MYMKGCEKETEFSYHFSIPLKWFLRTVPYVQGSLDTNITTTLECYPVFSVFFFFPTLWSIEDILLIQFSFKNLFFIIQFHLANFCYCLQFSPLTPFSFVYKYMKSHESRNLDIIELQIGLYALQLAHQASSLTLQHYHHAFLGNEFETSLT